MFEKTELEKMPYFPELGLIFEKKKKLVFFLFLFKVLPVSLIV